MATNKLFGRVIKVTIKGKSIATYTNDDLEIRFSVPFDDDPKPNASKVEIYNLSKDSIHRIKRGYTCTIQAGYKGDYGVLVSGKIASALTKHEGVDKITTINVIEGEDYSKVKVTAKNADPAEKNKKGKLKKQEMKITFKKGTKASTIIKKLCSILGIKLSVMRLPKDVVYKKGYTVTSEILDDIEEIVQDCGASMYYRRGKMVIRSIKDGTDEKFTLSEETGLIAPPEPFEEDGVRGYKVKCLLQHRITTASIIMIDSSTVKGKYRVKKGQHTADSSDFLTEIEAI